MKTLKEKLKLVAEILITFPVGIYEAVKKTLKEFPRDFYDGIFRNNFERGRAIEQYYAFAVNPAYDKCKIISIPQKLINDKCPA